jgi:adenylate cyclase
MEDFTFPQKGSKTAEIISPQVVRRPEMFRFGEYTLDVVRGCLRTAHREIELRPKSFEVLCYLVENAGRLVPKDELIKAVWPNVVVTGESLMQCVSEVRHALADDGQTIIKTVPRRGYRFAARVLPDAAVLGTDVPDSSTPTPSSQGGGELGRVGAWLDRPSVAVLPFLNLNGDPQQDYFSDGLTEDIITELSRFSELLVIARNSSFQYKGKAVDIRQVGRELGVRYVLEGSVRWSGDHIRIGAQLIDAATGAHRWAERYPRELHDAFAVQDEMVRAILATLASHVNRAETERVLLKPPAAWEAYEYYLRGAEAYFLHWSKPTKRSLYEARGLLEQSLAIDPGYARAYEMLSRTHLYAYLEPFDRDYLAPAALDRALGLAQTAVRLDPRLPQARAQLGYALLCSRQHDAAMAEFERTAALNPNFIDYRYALALIFVGEPARALEVLGAVIRLDPFPPSPTFNHVAVANYLLNRYGDAVHWCRECISRLPTLQWPHVMLACAYAQSGQLEDARGEAAEALRIDPGFTIEGNKRLLVFKDPKDAEHLIDGMRKAGLPER